jgi:transcriptional coactivator HFI1/ADA1
MVDYHQARTIKAPDLAPVHAPGIGNKTSMFGKLSWNACIADYVKDWEKEISKRYAQPLFSETNEFPTPETIQARLLPICYEEGVINGATSGCAEFTSLATEIFIREALNTFFSRVSTNGSTFVKTAAFKRQLDKEESAFLRGEITKNPAGLLPVEVEENAKRKPLDMSDLRLALQLGDNYLGQVPLIAGQILNTYGLDQFDDLPPQEVKSGSTAGLIQKRKQLGLNGTNGINVNGTNGVNGHAGDPMDLDEPPLSWQGISPKDQSTVRSVLDDLLAIGE